MKGQKNIVKDKHNYSYQTESIDRSRNISLGKVTNTPLVFTFDFLCPEV